MKRMNSWFPEWWDPYEVTKYNALPTVDLDTVYCLFNIIKYIYISCWYILFGYVLVNDKILLIIRRHSENLVGFCRDPCNGSRQLAKRINQGQLITAHLEPRGRRRLSTCIVSVCVLFNVFKVCQICSPWKESLKRSLMKSRFYVENGVFPIEKKKALELQPGAPDVPFG